MNTHIHTGHYLGVFLSNKSSPKWHAWYAKTDDEKRATDEAGLAAVKAWDEKHKDQIVYAGGPLGPTKRTSERHRRRRQRDDRLRRRPRSFA